MAKSKSSDQWIAFLSKLGPVLTGERTYTIADAARECGVDARAIRKAIDGGRIPRSELRQGEWGRGKKIALLTHRAIEDYQLSRSGLQPLTDTEKGAPSPVESTAPPTLTLPAGMPDNIADAKLRVEQLKIERLEAENMLARNQSMMIQDVIDINREVDLELIAALRSYVFRVAPMVAAENDILRCRTILETEMKEAMAVLERNPPTNGTPEA